MSETKKPTFVAGDEQSAMEAAEAKAAADGILDAPGEGRRENMRRTAEEMIAKADAILNQLGLEQGNPDQLEIDREVRQALNEFNEVYVSNQQDGFAYAWVFRDPRNEFGGRYVRKMQAMGFELIQGDRMEEAKEHKFVDGTRVVADCVLMRISLDRKFLLAKRDRLLRDAQQAGIVSRVYELADRVGSKVYDKLPGFVEEAIGQQANQRRAQAQTQFHRMNAGGRMDKMLRTGSIPGLPAAGTR